MLTSNFDPTSETPCALDQAADVSELEELSQEDLVALAARGFADPSFFCNFFLVDWFPSSIPWVHRGILAILTGRIDWLLDFDPKAGYGPRELRKILRHFTWKEDPVDPESKTHFIFQLHTSDDPEIPPYLTMSITKFTLIMMPRGFSKTTLINAVNIYFTVYEEVKFPLYVSETGPHAKRQVSNIARQLTGNPRIKMVFGELRPDQRNDLGLTWSESQGEIQTTNGVTFAARGRGSQVRGIQVNAVRPQRIICDDLEDKESVATVDQRVKCREWFYGDVRKALPTVDKSGTITCLGTLLHSEALLTFLMQDPDWTTVKFGAIDPDGDPLWEAAADLKFIAHEKRVYAKSGLLHVYYMELFNVIRASEDAKFKLENIIYTYTKPEKFQRMAIAIDPAISQKKEADFCSLSVVAMCEGGYFEILEQWSKKGVHPRQQVDKYFEFVTLWKMHEFPNSKYGIESNAYQAALVHLIREEMFRKKVYFEITPITQSQKKIERVEGILQPRYANGYIHHRRHFNDLESSLLDWPSGKLDPADVTAMAISLLDDAAPLAAPDNHDLAEDEYPPLEEIFEGDWRTS